MDIDKKIKSIHTRYPWVSESTFGAILSDSGDAVKIIMDLVKEVDESEKKFEEAGEITKGQNKIVNSLRSTIEKSKEYLKNYQGDSSQVIDTAIKNINDFGGAALRGSKKAADFMPSQSMYTKGFKNVIGGTETALLGFTGAMGVFAKMAMEQEKVLRVMIDHGVVTGDTSLYTTMRQNFASIGMTLNNGMENFKDSMPLFANAKGTIIENINTFALLTNRLKSDKSVADMGESYDGIMRGLVDHANRLHGVGRFIELDQITQKRVVERFQNSTAVSSALAETLGYKRKDQEVRKKEAVEDIDFRRAIISRGSFILEEYGNEAYDNITDSTEEIYSLAHKVFGPDFANQVQNLITRGINDIHRGGDISNNLTEEMNTMLMMLGPHVRSSFIHMMTKSTRGDFDRVQAADAFRLFIKEVDAAPDLNIQGLTNPLVAKTKLLKDMAEVVPDNFMNMPSHEFYTLAKTSSVFSEQSDDAVDAVDLMKSTFAEVSSLFLPGFQTMGDALYMFEKLYSTVGGLLAGVIDFITPEGDDDPSPTSQMVPPRPSRFGDMNGFLPTSSRHPMRKWDKAYGETYNPDGTLKDPSTVGTFDNSVHGTNPSSSSLKIENLPPLGDDIAGGGGIQMLNSGKIRGLGLDPKLMEVLQVASFEIGANVEVHSGGQMSIAEALSLGATKDGKKYIVNGKAVRIGSTRHDSGLAADIDLVDAKDGHKLDMTNEMDMARIYQFTKLAKGLGLTGIGAGDMHRDGQDAYMGKHRLHVGYGKEAAWGEGSSYANAPQWLKDLYDPRSGEYVETGSIDVTDSSLKANQTEQTPSSETEQVTDPNISEDEVGSNETNNNETQETPTETIPTARDVSPESRFRQRASMSSSRPRDVQSHETIPQSYETNALDALGEDMHTKFLELSSDRRDKITNEIESMIYDNDGNYVGANLSQEQVQRVVSLIDKLEKEEDLAESLSSNEFELPSSYINNELEKSQEFLTILDDIIANIENTEIRERAVE